MARLWRITGKSHYKDLSIVCLASILSHLWLWHLGPDIRTFMALPPLHGAPYVAFYEEGELKEDEAKAVEIWSRRIKCVVACRKRPGLSSCVTRCLSDGKACECGHQDCEAV